MEKETFVLMKKKYKLTDEVISYNNRFLYRIEALIDFNDVKKGDKGGFVESEENLSQLNDCWIYDNAKVCDKAYVMSNARVMNDAQISGNAVIMGNVLIYNNAKVCDYAEIGEYAKIYNNAKVYDHVCIYDNVSVHGNARLYGKIELFDNVEIYGNTELDGNLNIKGNAKIRGKRDYIIFKNWWSSLRYFIWTRSNNMWNIGCFCGTGEELIKKAYEDSEISGREYKRVVEYVEAILNEYTIIDENNIK